MQDKLKDIVKFKSFQSLNVPNHAGTQCDVFIIALGEDGKIYITDNVHYGKYGWTLIEKDNDNPTMV